MGAEPTRPEPFSGSVAGLGHGGRMVETDDPSVVHGCMFWGSGRADAGVSLPFEMPFDQETKSWFCREHDVGIGLDGRLALPLRAADPAVTFGVYASPNPADVALFVSAFVTALNLTAGPKGT